MCDTTSLNLRYALLNRGALNKRRDIQVDPLPNC